MQKGFILVDCNDFFANCERLFRPDLRDRPILVLSNNDGCVIARSRELKQGPNKVAMGVPYFQVREAARKMDARIFSCNHELYADISRRVMTTLASFTPDLEVYSVDEAFIPVSGSMEELELLGREVRGRVEKWVGVPVSVGLAPTKTLAKLASEYSKAHPGVGGVYSLFDPRVREEIMLGVPVEDVWGIGRRLAPKLRRMGIQTALDMARTPPAAIRRQFGVTVERVVRELQGLSCFDMDGEPLPSRKQIICSRSFGHKVAELSQLREATCMFIERSGLKLRREGKLCATMSVYAKAVIGHNGSRPVYHHIQASGSFDYPTDDTRQLMRMGTELLRKCWTSGYRYCKSGVVLSDLCDPGMVQLTFSPENRNPNTGRLMDTLDRLHVSGYNIHFAAQGLKKSWAPRKNLLSPNYTTRWSDIPRAG